MNGAQVRARAAALIAAVMIGAVGVFLASARPEAPPSTSGGVGPTALASVEPPAQPDATAPLGGVEIVRARPGERAENLIAARLHEQTGSSCGSGREASRASTPHAVLARYDADILAQGSRRWLDGSHWVGDKACAVAAFGRGWAAEDEYGFLWVERAMGDSIIGEALAYELTPAGHKVWTLTGDRIMAHAC